MSRTVKKLLISFVTGIYLLFSIVPTSVRAQAPGPWYSQGFQQWYSKVYEGSNENEIFGERYTAAQVQWVFYGFLSFVINAVASHTCNTSKIVGVFTGNASSFINDCSPKLSMQPASNSGQSFLAAIFADRPLSGITYVKDLGRKFHLVPEAKAQTAGPGFGYDALQSVRQLWQAARNVSYSLFVLVIVALAFMIMFRVKISPQVAITVQSALPKVVVALILVTFSYAIAGFLIDLMYVFIGLISLIFSGSGLFGNNPLELFNLFTTGFDNSGIFGFLVLYLVQFVTTFLTVAIVGALDGSFGGIVIGTLSIILAIVILVVMIFVLLWVALKILVTLIKAFAYILFLTIILPLQVTLGVVVPNIGIGIWLRLYIANLAVFPITAVLFALAFVFMEQGRRFVENNVPASPLQNFVITQGAVSNPGWPPLLGVGNSAMGLLFLAASFFIISLVPKAAEIVNGFVTGKLTFGNAMGEATNPFGLGGLARETVGTYLGNQLYNPRQGTGFIPDFINRRRAGTGSTRGQAAEAGTPGGGPTRGTT